VKANRFVVAAVALLATAAWEHPRAAGAPSPRLAELQARRARAMDAFPDGVLLVRARRFPAWSEDSFRQDQAFFYFTGLENTLGAVLAIDGQTRRTWLLLPAREPGMLGRRAPEAARGQEQALGVDTIALLGDLDRVFTTRKAKPVLYYMPEWAVAEAPLPATDAAAPVAPLFARVFAEKHRLRVASGEAKVQALMSIQTPAEQVHVRAAAAASSEALRAGLRAIAAGTMQRRVEGAVVKACLDAGARHSFWPWAMSGSNSEFPRPFEALGRYDHHDRRMMAGELVRLDVGCEVGHYEGDVGRTAPVSGRFDPAQRELWTAFVAAYRAAAATLRPGATEGSVFAAWRTELLRHGPRVKTELARRAIQRWSTRENVPYWQIHTTGLATTDVASGLREGMTVDLEPIASIDGVGYFLEDMYRITRDGTELLTPGLPTTADEIEAAMRPGRARRR
jgi:Xaa-Pro aminopeptidase